MGQRPCARVPGCRQAVPRRPVPSRPGTSPRGVDSSVRGRGAHAPLPCARAWRAPRGQHVSVGRTPRALSERRLHSVALPLEKESREERGKETSKDVGKGNAAAGTCAVEHSGSLLIGSSAPLGTGPALAPRTPAAARRWGAEWRFSFCFQWKVTHCVSELGDQKSPRLTHRRCRSDPAV